MLDGFHKSTSDWFASAFDAPTKIQNRAWPEIQNRAHTLIAAPTGLGETLAAFLATIDELVKQRIKGSLSAKTQESDFQFGDGGQVVTAPPGRGYDRGIRRTDRTNASKQVWCDLSEDCGPRRNEPALA